MAEITYNNGVKEIIGRLYDSDYKTVVIPYSSASEYNYVYSPGVCKLAENVEGYDFVTNFTPFATCGSLNLGLRISGVTYESYHPYNPYLVLGGVPQITHVAKGFNSYSSASQGFRYIIEKGIKNPNANSDWDILNPIRLVGVNLAGDLVNITVKGRQTTQRGWTLHEAAEYGLSIGLYMLIDVDGGGSSQEYLLKDSQKDMFIGTASRRAVPVFLAVRFKTPIVTVVTPPPLEWPEFFYLENPDGERKKYIREA